MRARVHLIEWGNSPSPKNGFFNVLSGTSATVRGLEREVAAPVDVDLRKGFTMEFRIEDFRLLLNFENQQSTIGNLQLRTTVTAIGFLPEP